MGRSCSEKRTVAKEYLSSRKILDASHHGRRCGHRRAESAAEQRVVLFPRVRLDGSSDGVKDVKAPSTISRATRDHYCVVVDEDAVDGSVERHALVQLELTFAQTIRSDTGTIDDAEVLPCSVESDAGNSVERHRALLRKCAVCFEPQELGETM